MPLKYTKCGEIKCEFCDNAAITINKNTYNICNICYIGLAKKKKSITESELKEIYPWIKW